MKRIILVFLGLFSLAYGQTSKTGAKTFFVNGLWMGTKLDSYFNSADSNAIYWRADSLVMAKYRGTARALSFRDDTSFLTNRFVRLQTGNLYRQDGNMWISGTIKTDGLVQGLRVSANNTGSTPAINGQNTSTGRAGSFTAATGVGAYVTNRSATNPSLKVIQDSTASIAQFYNNFDLGVMIDTSADITISNLRSDGAFTGKIQLPTISANRTYALPNASGTIALTSNVTDSAAALRASINTKLNISDTAAMKANITLDRVLQNGNTTGLSINAIRGIITDRTASNTFGSGPFFTWNDNTASRAIGFQLNTSYGLDIQSRNPSYSKIGEITPTGALRMNDSLVTQTGIRSVGGMTATDYTAIASAGVFSSVGGGAITVAQSGVFNSIYPEYISYQKGGFQTDIRVRQPTSNRTVYFQNKSYTVADSADVASIAANYVPYTGATTNVNLGSNTLTAGGATLTGALSGTSGTFSSFGSFRNTNEVLVINAINANDAQWIAYRNSAGTRRGYVGYGLSSSGNFYINNDENAPIIFQPNATEAGRVVPAGRWLFGTTTDDGSSIIQANGQVSISYALNLATGVNQVKARWLGYNGAYARLTSDVGFDATFNGVALTSNTNISGSAQGNTSIPSWSWEIGSSDAFKIKRSPAGSFTFTDLVTISGTGAATFSSSVTAKTYAENVVSVSTTYTVASDVGTVFASSNTYTITLPSASGNAGRTITIKRTSSGFGTSIIISGVTLGTSENGGSLPCHAAAIYKSDGTNWYCISYHAGGCF